MQAPIIDELTKEYENKVRVFKLDVDKNQQTAQDYQVMSIPTIVLFKNGKEIERLMGLQQKPVLTERINNLLK